MKYVELNNENGLDSLKDFFDSLEIEYEFINQCKSSSFSRTVKFTLKSKEYIIEWFVNESNLYIGAEDHFYNSPRIPFKYIYLDESYPVKGKWLGFAHQKHKPVSVFDRIFDWAVIRLPF